MNIWIFNHHALPPDISGGTRHYDISCELVKAGHNVTIFASSFHYAKLEEFREYNDNFYIEEEISGVKFVWLKTIPYQSNGLDRLKNMLSYNKSTKKYLLSKKIEKPDIIIGSTVHLFAVNLAYKLSKKYKSRFFVEVRDFWPYTLVALGKMKKTHPIVILFHKMEKKLYKKAEKIITLFDKGHLYLEKFVKREKIIYIPNSFNTDIFNNIIEQKMFDDKKFNVVYAGTIGIPNEVLTFVKAAELTTNKNIVFNIIGEGKDKQEIQSYVKEKQLENVIFHSALTKNELIGALRNADVLWAGMKDTKLYEFGFSFNKIYDYMASARPIILSTSVKNNIIDTAQCGYSIQAENPEAISEGIVKFYNFSEHQRTEIGKKGYNYLMENITTKAVSQKLIKELEVR
ncbi:MAG: glycosyltransferase family 4 protein [Bacteroidales bacterium]|nr:glycosyltransferase family 4 protein [Bacteroidales bacterium]